MFSSLTFSSSTLIRSALSRGWSNAAGMAKLLNFKDFNDKKAAAIVLDVREKGELSTDGKIPGTRHLPLGEIQNAIKMDNKAFQDKYGFAKPSTNDQIIIHCKSGARASGAAKEFLNAGYGKVEVYPGILDWVQNGGKVERN